MNFSGAEDLRSHRRGTRKLTSLNKHDNESVSGLLTALCTVLHLAVQCCRF